MPRRSHAYLLGQQAVADGDDAEVNPYDKGTNDFDDWEEGFHDAQTEQDVEEED